MENRVIDTEAGLTGYPVRIQDIERQQRWEAEAVEEGVRRYRRAIAEADLPDTPAGVIAMREMFNGLVPAIRAAQDEAIAGLTAKEKGRNPEWWWYISFLSAEKLAVIAARTLLTTTSTDRTPFIREGSVSIYIGSAVMLEMELERWKADEAEAAREDDKHVDLFKLMKMRQPNATARDFRRWRRKIAAIERLDWPKNIRLQVGHRLVQLAVEHGGGWFERRVIFRQGRSERTIVKSDAAHAAIQDINARLEINRPLRVPMLCPPKPWRRLLAAPEVQ
jgi:DNA-directed RNA polymerase